MATTNPDPNRHPSFGDSSKGAQSLVKTLRLAFFCLRTIIFLLLVIYIFSGPFVVAPDEKALVLRFGGIVGDTREEQVRTSGKWHWAWPKPIDRVIRIPVKESREVDTDQFWYNQTNLGAIQPQQTNLSDTAAPLITGTDGYLITGDANILHAKWRLTYFISDPIAYYKNYQDPDDVIQKLFENVILKETAATPIDASLYGESTDLRNRILDGVKRAVRRHGIGVEARHTSYLDANPPQTSLLAFQGIHEAVNIRDKAVKDAETYKNQVVREAKGQAAAIKADGEVYRSQIVTRIKADVDYFQKILPKYREAPETMLLTLYLDAIAEIMSTAKVKYVFHTADSDKQEIRIHINPKPKTPKIPEAP